jgi:hypothetical protein
MKRGLAQILGLFAIMLAVVFASGIATIILVPQLMAMFVFFGFEAGEPNVWDVYLALMVLFVAPIIVLLTLAFRRQTG